MRERQILDEAVDVILGSGEEGEGEDGAVGKEDEGGLIHRGTIFLRMIFVRMVFLFVRKVFAYDLHRSDGERIGIVNSLEALGSYNLSEWSEIVLSGLEARVGRLAFTGDEDGGHGGWAGGFGRALESGQENLVVSGAFWFELFRAENPSGRDFAGEGVGAIAVEAGGIVVGAGVGLGGGQGTNDQNNKRAKRPAEKPHPNL